MIEYILILGAVQGIFLAAFLFTKKENKIANKLLGLALFGYAIDILNTLYVYTELYYTYPAFIGAFSLMPFLYAPAIYLYSKFLRKRKSETISKKELLHFIPFLIFQIFGPLYLLFQSNSYKLILMESTSDKPLISLIVGSLIPFYGLAYIILAIFEAKKFNKEIRQNYSNIEKVKLDWLVILLFGIAVIWVLEVIQYIITRGLTESNIPMYILIYISISILIYTIGFFALKLPQVFISEVEENPKSESYSKSGLSEERANEILNKLENYIVSEKPFTKNDLKSAELAEAIDTSLHNLSEVLNRNLNQSFYDYVQSYRISEVKRLIEKDKEKQFTLLAHAMAAGFSSKSSFNTTFKKITNQTPSEYRESIIG